MTLVKTLLRQKLNENFFEKVGSPLDEVIESAKNIFINLRDIVGEKHKLDFFKDRLAKALTELKTIDKITGVPDKLSEMEEMFDSSILKLLKLGPLLMKLSKASDKEKAIDAYLEDLDENVKSVFSKYKEKIKADKTYEVISEINDDTKKTTLKKFMKEKYYLQIELLKLQEWVKENNKKVLIIFEGRDAAGKGSNIDTFGEFLNPKGFRVETFGIPTEADKKDWFKRYTKVLPKEGEIVLFDRSYYNRAVIEPAMGYCTKAQYKEFMDSVGEYEENLINKKDTILIKIWLDVTKTRQKLRFELRKRNPLGYWKFSDNDSKMLEKWDKLTPYIDKMLKETNIAAASWEIISADDKFKSMLTSMTTILRNIHYDGKDVDVLFSKKMDVVFLDLHGVLISKWHKRPDGELDCNKGWDKAAIKNLNKITDTTGAGIVVISDCKKELPFIEFEEMLKEAGVTGEIIGKTIDIDKHLRIEQINTYLTHHKVDKYVILDDKPFDYAKDKAIEKVWIQPEHHVGLTEEQAQKAIELFESE